MHLTMLLDMASDGFGDRVVIGRRADGITAAALRERALTGATLIREADADALIYIGPNGPSFPVAMFAAAYANVPLVPLNYRLGERQLAQLIAKHPHAVAIVEPVAADCLQSSDIESWSVAGWLDATAVTTSTEPVDPDDVGPAVVIYTSGTTSDPKGVLLSHDNLVSYVLGSVEFMNAAEDEAALVSVPPYHIAAVANVISNVYGGRRTVALEHFEPERWLQTARSEGVTNALVVPTMLARIVDAVANGVDGTLPAMRALAYGGAPMPPVIIERALATWPNIDFVNAYGLTETSSTVVVLGPEDHRAAFASTDPKVRARLSSVGKPLPGIALEIRDVDDAVLPAGLVGRICVSGAQVSAEYAGVGRAVDERGFFDTRDTGYVDADGYLFVGGRADDTIIRGAENIAPAEIEEVLYQHPAVIDVAVVGVPDEEWGHRIEAAVVVREGATVQGDELREFTRSSLRSSKTPERIWFWPEIPRTETGKLVRRRVLDRILKPETGSRPGV